MVKSFPDTTTHNWYDDKEECLLHFKSNNEPTNNPTATEANVPTTKGINMRTKPCTNTLRFIPKILPTTKQEIYKYKSSIFSLT